MRPLTAAALLAATMSAQAVDVADLLARFGVQVGKGGVEAAFDDGLAPTVPVPALTFGPLAAAMNTEDIRTAYAFGVLAGRGARSVAQADLATAGVALVRMIGASDRRGRVAGARVAGRVFAVPLEGQVDVTRRPVGLVERLFSLLNEPDETEQLAAMDALGLIREPSALQALTERYAYYRQKNKRALAGGAIEALARIGHPSSAAIVQALTGDAWAARDDAAGLAVLFARERLLKDGSIAQIRHIAIDRARAVQARTYLAELAPPTP